MQLFIQASSLDASINSKQDLISISQISSKDIKYVTGMDSHHFLLALMTIESSMGLVNVPRFEYSYSRNSLAYKRSKLLQIGYDRFGDLMACSYGPAQILAIVAMELGYNDHPLLLWHAQISMPYVIKLLNKLIDGGADTVQRLAASYNGGLGAIKNTANWPANYVKRFSLAYEKVQSEYR